MRRAWCSLASPSCNTFRQQLDAFKSSGSVPSSRNARRRSGNATRFQSTSSAAACAPRVPPARGQEHGHLAAWPPFLCLARSRCGRNCWPARAPARVPPPPDLPATTNDTTSSAFGPFSRARARWFYDKGGAACPDGGGGVQGTRGAIPRAGHGRHAQDMKDRRFLESLHGHSVQLPLWHGHVGCLRWRGRFETFGAQR